MDRTFASLWQPADTPPPSVCVFVLQTHYFLCLSRADEIILRYFFSTGLSGWTVSFVRYERVRR